MWSVPPPSREEASHTHDVTTIEYLPSSLNEVIEKSVKDLAGSNGVVVHTLPKDSVLFPKMPQEHTKQLLNADGAVTLTDGYLLDALQRTRLLKDADEIEMIKQANQISSRAHEVVMRVLGMAVKRKLECEGNSGRPLLPGEWLIEKEAEAEAIFVASCRREGWDYVHPTPFINVEYILSLGQFTKHISPLLLPRHVPRRYTTAAMTKSLPGDPSSRTSIVMETP